MIRQCLSSAAGNVLEVGCGDGHLTADLARVADNLVAVDPHLEALRSARRRVEIPVKFITALGESLPIATDSIDTVVFTISLHHQEPNQALNEARRVLKEGGKILVLEPVADSLLSRVFAVLDDESSKYKLAEKAIDGSGLSVLRSGSVRTLWVFDDFTELVFYLFGYFGLPLNREKENRMSLLLSDRQGLAPLAVEDVTRFWVLCER